MGLLRPRVATSHWSQAAFAANTTGAKKLKSAAGKDSVPGIPRGRGFTHTAELTRTQAGSPVPTRTPTRVHTHSGARATGVRWGGDQASAQASSPGFTCPRQYCDFVVVVAVNLPGPRGYLFPKLSPVTKSNLKRWNNQCRLLQSTAPCASWN